MTRRSRRSRIKHEAHDGFRTTARVLGPILIVVGFGMFLVGILGFFEKFNEGPRLPGLRRPDEPSAPDRFWLCFVGMPIAMAGMWCVKVGYLGAAARYVAAETAPVARDTINYIVDGTRESLHEVASALRGDEAHTACPSCGHGNDADAEFCEECGAAMPGERTCPRCNKDNHADAKFCDGCGAPLAAPKPDAQ